MARRKYGPIGLAMFIAQPPDNRLYRASLLWFLCRADFLNQELQVRVSRGCLFDELLRGNQRVQPWQSNQVNHMAQAFCHLYNQILFHSFHLIAQRAATRRPPSLSPLDSNNLGPDTRRAQFLGSTSTYSASITPSSFFFSWPAPVAPLVEPPAAACGPAPSAGGGVACALYMASASLCDALVSFSRAAFIAPASEPS